jgi:hypothetical protein
MHFKEDIFLLQVFPGISKLFCVLVFANSWLTIVMDLTKSDENNGREAFIDGTKSDGQALMKLLGSSQDS